MQNRTSQLELSLDFFAKFYRLDLVPYCKVFLIALFSLSPWRCTTALHTHSAQCDEELVKNLS